jgi:hypothetical protein
MSMVRVSFEGQVAHWSSPSDVGETETGEGFEKKGVANIEHFKGHYPADVSTCLSPVKSPDRSSRSTHWR